MRPPHIRIIGLLLCFTSIAAFGEGASEDTQRLIKANQLNDLALAKELIEKGANVNALHNDGYSILMESVLRCGGVSASRAPRVEFTQFLLSHGANAHAITSRGITALMIADRVGSKEAAALLKSHGAEDYDASNVRTKAVLTLIDANLLLYLVGHHTVDQGLSDAVDKVITFDGLEPYLGDITYKIVASKGVDLFGNTFSLHSGIERVYVNPKTVAAASKDVDRDFWRPYLPDE